jgi:hypothetical protein
MSMKVPFFRGSVNHHSPAVHTQVHSDCWAHCIASLIRATKLRIKGGDRRALNGTSYEDMLEEMYELLPGGRDNGASDTDMVRVLTLLCAQRGWRLNTPDKKGAVKALLDGKTVGATFELTERQWNELTMFTERYPNEVYHVSQNRAGNSQGHAVLLVGISDRNDGNGPYIKIKNSWGPERHDEGYFRVSMNGFEFKKFFDIIAD